MKYYTMKRVAAFAVAVTTLLVLGCSDNSTEPKITKPRYLDPTTKDIVVSNLLQSYKDRNIEQFEKLLHTDYTWYNQAADVQNGAPEFYTRDEDIQKTRNMFLAALHKHPDSSKWLDRLALSISSAPWTQITELEGNPCEDCWQTTREYYITLVFTGGTTTLLGNDLVTMYVVPITKDGTKLYYLRRVDDIKKP